MTRDFTSHGDSMPWSRMYATSRRSVCSASIRNASSRSDASTSGRNASARACAASFAGTISPRRSRSSSRAGVMSTISSSVTWSRNSSSTTCAGRGPSIAPIPSTVLCRSVRCSVAISIMPARSSRGTDSVIGRPSVSTPARSSRHATSGLRRSRASTSTTPARAGEFGPPRISRPPSATSQRAAPVGLHRGDHDIRAALPAPVRLVEHGHSRPAAACVAEIDSAGPSGSRSRAAREAACRSPVARFRAERKITPGRCGPRDHVDAHVRQLRDQPVDETAVEPGADPGMCRLADHDMLHRKLLRDGHHGVGELALALDEPALEQLGKLFRLGPGRSRSRRRACPAPRARCRTRRIAGPAGSRDGSVCRCSGGR